MIISQYYNWLLSLVDDKENSIVRRYLRLMNALYMTEFDYRIAKDSNRASDGVNLRNTFAYQSGYGTKTVNLYLTGQCRVLEMMVALACRCECEITGNDDASKWFWVMVDSLGLSDMTDDNFDEALVNIAIDKFMKGQYQRNGKGSLFTVNKPPRDMRKTELWYQMCYYLDNVLEM